jgi:hypothetical protein
VSATITAPTAAYTGCRNENGMIVDSTAIQMRRATPTMPDSVQLQCRPGRGLSAASVRPSGRRRSATAVSNGPSPRTTRRMIPGTRWSGNGEPAR